MYAAIPDDCGCGGASAVGSYPSSPYGLPGSGGITSRPSFPSFPSSGGSYGISTTGLPLDYTSNQSWYDPIIDFAGDIAGDLLVEAKDWLLRRIGRETWDRMPEQSKQEAVRAALEDLGGRAGVPTVTWPWLIAGGALLFVLLSRSR